MAVKNISIMNDVYRMLLNSKIHNESFSDVLRRILSKKRSITEFAGAWNDLDDKESENIKNDMENFRKNFSKELIKRGKKYDLS